MPRLAVIIVTCASLLAPLGCGGSECADLMPAIEAVEAALAKPDFDAARAATAALEPQLAKADSPRTREISARSEQLAAALEASNRQGTQEENMRAADRLASVISMWRTAAATFAKTCR